MPHRTRIISPDPEFDKLVLTTTCGPDDQFSSPKQIRWSAALGMLLVANAYIHVRNADLSFFSKLTHPSYTSLMSVDSDSANIFGTTSNALRKFDLSMNYIGGLTVLSTRMIDASGDPDYVYVTSNNATDGHGVRKVRKSDMTIVASLLATGAGDGQFNNPLGVKYYDGHVYVADCDNARIVKLLASDLSYVSKVDMGNANWKPYDLDCDADNAYITIPYLGSVYKQSAGFTNVVVSLATVACLGYSLCIIPDQGDGNGATLAISNNSGNCLYRRKCSDLSLIATVGTSGSGADTLCDPTVTGPAGIYSTGEDQISAASGATPAKNGFTGFFFRTDGSHRVTYRPTGGKVLSDITGIDFSDDKISGEIKNLNRCVNLTSCKLQTNPSLVLNTSSLSAKMVTLWAYACGSGIYGSIRHMLSATSINLRENGASQAQVDQWIDDIYVNRETTTPGTANFNGSNAAPSATGKAQADELINDYGWSIAYTP